MTCWRCKRILVVNDLLVPAAAVRMAAVECACGARYTVRTERVADAPKNTLKRRSTDE